MAIVELRDTIELGFGQIQKAIEDPWRTGKSVMKLLR